MVLYREILIYDGIGCGDRVVGVVYVLENVVYFWRYLFFDFEIL